MATPPSDDTRTLFRLIADGNWHNYVMIREQIAASVPPGRALRKYQERIDNTRKQKNDPSYDSAAGEGERIYFGAKSCAQIAITSWRNRGVEQRGKDGEKEIRIVPGFTSWGLEIEEAPDPRPEGSRPSGRDQEARDDPPVPGVSLGVMEMINGMLVRQIVEPKVEEQDPYGDELTLEQDVEPQDVFAPPDPVEMGYVSPGPVTQSELEVDHSDCRDAPDPVPEPELKPQAKDPSEMALFSESEIRHLISEEIAKALDGFQTGMEQFMNRQFDQLGGLVTAKRGRRGRWYFDPEG